MAENSLEIYISWKSARTPINDEKTRANACKRLSNFNKNDESEINNLFSLIIYIFAGEIIKPFFMQFELTKEFIDDVIKTVKERIMVLVEKSRFHPADIAEILEIVNLPTSTVYKLLAEELASEVLVEIEEDTRDKFLASFSAEEIAESLDKMYADDATDVIQELPEEVQEEVLEALKDDEHSSEISILLNYDEDSAGGIMDMDFISANWNWTVKMRSKKFREQVEDVDHVYTIYVVDSDKKLKGTLSLKRFLYASDDTLIKDIFLDNPISVEVNEEAETVASKMEKYDLVAIPVIDANEELLEELLLMTL